MRPWIGAMVQVNVFKRPEGIKVKNIKARNYITCWLEGVCEQDTLKGSLSMAQGGQKRVVAPG